MHILHNGGIMLINCAFEGGGIKGLTYVGVLEYFEENGFQVHKAVGTSVGSIFAIMAVARFRVKEIKKIIEDLDIKTIISKNSFKTSIKELGLNNIYNLEKKIDDILKLKNINTFKDLRFGDDYSFKVVTTDYNTRKGVVIPDDLPKYHIDKDSFRVSKAIAMSCCLPLVYSIYNYNGYKFIDGGASCKFPIHLLYNSKNPIIGLKIGNDKSIVNKLQNKMFSIDNINSNHNNHNIYIININTLGLRASQFTKGLDNKEDLYTAGYLSIKNYFRDYK